MTPEVRLYLGDCLEILPTLADASVDAIVCDPPYPEIDRPYGRMTEGEWHAMMRQVVTESRRILKPTGSAVFILQPNSEKVGRMRPWLWEFMAWTSREWNMVQDAWWWNFATRPAGGAATSGLMRGSLKACVWLGASCCHRDQDAVLWDESVITTARRLQVRAGRCRHSGNHPSGAGINDDVIYNASESRGGVTPFNVLPLPNDKAAATSGHGAGTPIRLADWWARYLCPPGGTICDPFMGSGTSGIVSMRRGLNYLGIEKMAKYHAVAEQRIAEAQADAASCLNFA